MCAAAQAVQAVQSILIRHRHFAKSCALKQHLVGHWFKLFHDPASG